MWEFIKSSSNQTNYLKGHSKEVCFIGRSNVGKSSLINALARQKIAKTSNTPGRTQLINFFSSDKKIIVDLPGYGFAKMSKNAKAKMTEMINEYFLSREELIKTFILIDAKVGPQKNDLEFIEFFKENNFPFFIIITKTDKAKQSELNQTLKKVKNITHDSLVTSSKKGTNINKLDRLISSLF